MVGSDRLEKEMRWGGVSWRRSVIRDEGKVCGGVCDDDGHWSVGVLVSGVGTVAVGQWRLTGDGGIGMLVLLYMHEL